MNNHNYWKSSDIPELSLIAQHEESLRQDLLKSYAAGEFVSPTEKDPQLGIDGWTILPFFMRRTMYEDNLRGCPRVAECLETLRKVKPLAGMWAAALEAGTEIPMFRHVENTRLRAYFVLQAGLDTALEIEDEAQAFVEGEILILEPCLEHRLWNRDPSGKPRLVLAIDLWHPLLSMHEIAALQFIERMNRA
jgi:aspartyl/asparaginyl beta-hydroxylase (cupin superfamily)